MSTMTVSTEEFLVMLENCLAPGREFPLQITGYSMRPFLRNGKDQVFLISKEERKPEPGDILFFVRDNGACVLHRLHRVLEDGRFVMNGDAQTWTEIIREEQVRAVVSAVQRGKRRISVDSKVYRNCVKIWTAVWPARTLIYGTEDWIYRALKKIGLRK